jgi:NhaP-type Na+/H+ or K+/H+ antiporter
MMRAPQVAMETQAAVNTRRRDIIFWGAVIGALSIIFVLLPATEMRFYPSNTAQELTMQAVAGAGVIFALLLEAYALLRNPRRIVQPSLKT